MPNKRQLQARATRQTIIDAMQRLIAEKGYDQVTVDDIAAACGIGRGTLYHYFPGKDAIFGYIERERFDGIPARVAERGLPTVEERLRAYVTLWFENVLKDSANISAYWYRQALAHQLPVHEGRNGTHFDDDIANLERLLVEAVEKGELRPDTPTGLIARDIVFAINGATYYRCIDEGFFSLEEWSQDFADKTVAVLVAPFRT